MGRLIDIDNLKGCAIIRPTSHESIEHIKQCGDDVLNHNDIPTAYNVEKVVAELESEVERWRESGEEYNDKHDIAVSEGFKRAVPIVRKGGVE